MKEADYKEAVHQPGAYQGFERLAVDAPAAKWKGKVTLTRKVRFTGRTGVRYEKLAAVLDRGTEVQPRKWGVRRDRYFVDHTPKGQTENVVYATVIAVPGSFRVIGYYVNGEEVTKEIYNSYRTAGAAKGKPLGDANYMDIILSTLTALPKHTLTDEQVEADQAAEAEEVAA